MHYLVVTAVLAAFAWLMWRDRGRTAGWGLRWTGFAASLRALAWPTLTLLAAGLAWAGLTDQLQPRWSRMAGNVLTYPLSALIQLLLLQVLLLRRLERLSDVRGAIVLGTAAVFGLAHWPNPLVALGCFLGAIFWCRAFLKFGNLPAIALSMGLLAAILGNAVPREAIDNARTGPIHIQREIDAAARQVSWALPCNAGGLGHNGAPCHLAGQFEP